MGKPLYVTPSGEPFDLGAAYRLAEQQPKRRAQPKARTGDEAEDFMSMGFVVQGLTREMLASARDARQRAIDGYDASCEIAKQEHKPQTRRPQLWGEQNWLNTAKRAKVRTRPFEIRAAAEELRTLALKQDWLMVEVVELRRERKS